MFQRYKPFCKQKDTIHTYKNGLAFWTVNRNFFDGIGVPRDAYRHEGQDTQGTRTHETTQTTGKLQESIFKKLLLITALFTWDILKHNISIKRYCGKNIFLSHGYLKAKVSSLQKYKSR
jgi:hypothetical protein